MVIIKDDWFGKNARKSTFPNSYIYLRRYYGRI